MILQRIFNLSFVVRSSCVGTLGIQKAEETLATIDRWKAPTATVDEWLLQPSWAQRGSIAALKMFSSPNSVFNTWGSYGNSKRPGA